MRCHTNVTERAQSLADSLFALDEPWRERFLSVVSCWAVGQWPTEQQAPTREELIEWLANRDLHREVSCLLEIWSGQRG